MGVERIGRYEIVGKLGEGGMASVLHGYDPRFKRDVAIKVLPHELLFKQIFRERFEREAQTIAALEHHAIVPVYDYGEESGQPYLVMRYMTGGSLAERIEQTGLSPAEASLIIKRIGSALDKAHSRGIIHRDIKPSNIMFDEEGAAYLSDFGIVKLTEATSNLTGGGMIGTPGYMAPEIGNEGGVSPSIDVYALGVTLFQMLAGRMPYNADTPQGMFVAHATRPIPDIRKVRPELSSAMQDVIARAMAKDPVDRYGSAGELAAALAKVAAKQKPEPTQKPSKIPTPPVPDQALTRDVDLPPAYETKQQGQRRVFGRVIGGMVGIVALIGAIVLGLMLARGAADDPSDNVAGASVTPGEIVGTETATEAVGEAGEAPTAGEVSTATIAPGFPGNPVRANDQWIPVRQEFGGIEMALVPAGCFTMGSDTGDLDERPAHQVCFDQPFWIDVNEVTNGQFGGAATGCTEFSSSEDQPRICVTWEAAQTHCETRSARLPTEAEWEFAARGPDGLIYPWGNAFEAKNLVFKTNAGEQTGQVGSKPDGASWVGALDLSGNVWEWINDWYSDSHYATLIPPVINPQGPESGEFKGLRGGSWFNDDVNSLRASFRNRIDPAENDYYYGFRCARDWSPTD